MENKKFGKGDRKREVKRESIRKFGMNMFVRLDWIVFWIIINIVIGE